SLSLVSKYFNQLSTPALYHTYRNHKAREWARHWYVLVDVVRVELAKPPLPPFRPFLRTITQRPDLAALVKVVIIGPWESKGDVDTDSSEAGDSGADEPESIEPLSSQHPDLWATYRKRAEEVGLTDPGW